MIPDGAGAGHDGRQPGHAGVDLCPQRIPRGRVHPLLIIPQALLGEIVWPLDSLPARLQTVAYVTPITYANRARRHVALNGWGRAPQH